MILHPFFMGFSHKKCMGYFRFLLAQTGLFTARNPTLCMKKFDKNPLNYFLWKVTKFHADSDNNESAREKKL